jgi:hypothetical protein
MDTANKLADELIFYGLVSEVNNFSNFMIFLTLSMIDYEFV